MPILFFALLAEAKPWIQKAKAYLVSQKHGTRIYRSEFGWIVVSGPGKLAMARAVSNGFFTFQAHGISAEKVWNLGIAGATDLEFPLGNFYWIHSVTELSSRKTIYPDRFVPSVFPKEVRLYTSDLPVTAISLPGKTVWENRDPAGLVDMEAFAFWETAIQYFPRENLSLGKLVSDHLEGEFCSAIQVETWMEKICLELWDEWIQPLPWLKDDPIPESEKIQFKNIIEEIHLTESMRIELNKSFRFFKLRYPDKELPISLPEILPKTKQQSKQLWSHWKKQLHV